MGFRDILRMTIIVALCVGFITYDEDQVSLGNAFQAGSFSLSETFNAIAEKTGKASATFSFGDYSFGSGEDEIEEEEEQVPVETESPTLSPTPTPKKKPIAICYSGQTRTFGLEEVYNNHLHNIIDPLREFADVFFVMSMGGDGKGALPPEEAAKCNNESHVKGYIAESLFKAKHFFQDDFAGDVAKKPPQCKEMGWAVGYKWKHCARVIKEQEEKQGWKYEWVMRMRPDLIFANKIEEFEKWPDIEKFREEKAVWVAGVTGCGSRGIAREIMPANDNWALMTRAAMDSYYEEYGRWFMECRKVPRHPMTFTCAESVLGGTLHFNKVKVYIADVGYLLVRPNIWGALHATVEQAKSEGVDLSIKHCYQHPGECRKYCQGIKREDVRDICFRGIMGVLLWNEGNGQRIIDIEKCVCPHSNRPFSVRPPPCGGCVDNARWNVF